MEIFQDFQIWNWKTKDSSGNTNSSGHQLSWLLTLRWMSWRKKKKTRFFLRNQNRSVRVVRFVLAAAAAFAAMPTRTEDHMARIVRVAKFVHASAVAAMPTRKADHHIMLRFFQVVSFTQSLAAVPANPLKGLSLIFKSLLRSVVSGEPTGTDFVLADLVQGRTQKRD